MKIGAYYPKFRQAVWGREGGGKKSGSKWGSRIHHWISSSRRQPLQSQCATKGNREKHVGKDQGFLMSSKYIGGSWNT